VKKQEVEAIEESKERLENPFIQADVVMEEIDTKVIKAVPQATVVSLDDVKLKIGSPFGQPEPEPLANKATVSFIKTEVMG
jgi:hypothetical protein